MSALLVRMIGLAGMPLLLLLAGCGEEFLDTPPFPEGPATVSLDADDFVTITPVPEQLDGYPVFPFAYQVFDERFEGYMAHSTDVVYTIEAGQIFDDRVPFLDFTMEKGDTLHTFTPRKYHILIDRRQTAEGEDIFFILRRTRRGISDLEERQVWIVSATRGVLSVADYRIDPFTGAVTLDMVGDTEWFRDSNITRLIKFYDYIRTIYMDRDRSLLYEFNKVTGVLKCRDIKAREEIASYQFDNPALNELIEFHIEPRNGGVVLITESNCYQFSEGLSLLSTADCQK